MFLEKLSIKLGKRGINDRHSNQSKIIIDPHARVRLRARKR